MTWLFEENDGMPEKIGSILAAIVTAAVYLSVVGLMVYPVVVT